MIIKVKNPEALKEMLSEKELVLYGMGTIGRKIAEWLDSQKIHYVVADRNIKGKQENVHKAIVSPEEVIRNHKEANIIVSTNLYFDEIKNELLNQGFKDSQILSFSLFIPENLTWKDLEDNIDWNLMKPSVELFARWIEPEDKSLIDYGAGQMYLKNFLASDVIYYPIDYIKRFDETIVCDLNTGDFPNVGVDVVVLNGVLEFLSTAEKLLEHVCQQARKKIIISYMTLDKFSNRESRRASGYVSDLTEQRIIELLHRGGFELVCKTTDPLDVTDTIYLFNK